MSKKNSLLGSLQINDIEDKNHNSIKNVTI